MRHWIAAMLFGISFFLIYLDSKLTYKHMIAFTRKESNVLWAAKSFFFTAQNDDVFFIALNCSFFMSIIFCSSIALVWTFNSRGVYNFITKEANILVNLVLFFNDVWFPFCRFLKYGVTDELKSLLSWKCKNVRVIYSKQGKVLLLKKRYFG